MERHKTINIKTKNYDHPTCIKDGDHILTEPISISNSFNDYFTSIADKILNKRKYNGTKSYRDFLSNRLLENFIFKFVTKKKLSLLFHLLIQANPVAQIVFQRVSCTCWRITFVPPSKKYSTYRSPQGSILIFWKSQKLFQYTKKVLVYWSATIDLFHFYQIWIKF